MQCNSPLHMNEWMYESMNVLLDFFVFLSHQYSECIRKISYLEHWFSIKIFSKHFIKTNIRNIRNFYEIINLKMIAYKNNRIFQYLCGK
jgi:hypothetical protein